MLFGKNKKCIVCGKSQDSTSNKDDSYISYEIVNNTNKTVGKMVVHKNLQCFIAGSAILKKQQEQAIDAPYIICTNKINGKKYTYNLLRTNDYFTMPLYSAVHDKKGIRYELRKDTYKFLQEFINSDSIIMIFMQALKNTPEAHIPLLASINDSVIPQGLLQSIEYKKRKSDAMAQMKTSLDVRGNDKIQTAQIMNQYVQDTAILI